MDTKEAEMSVSVWFLWDHRLVSITEVSIGTGLTVTYGATRKIS